MTDDKPAPNGLEVQNHHEILNQEESQNDLNIKIQLQENEDRSPASRESGYSEEISEKILAETWDLGKPGWSIASLEDLFEHWSEFSKTFGRCRNVLGQYEFGGIIQIHTPIIPTNHIKLHAEKDRSVYEYKVHFVPGVGNVRYRQQLVNQALGHLSTTRVPRVLKIFYTTSLYLPSQYITDKQEFECDIPDTGENVKVVITFKQKRKMQECPDLFLELFHQIKKLFYFGNHTLLPIRQQLEYYPGDVRVVKEVEDGLLLICQDPYWKYWNRKEETTNIYELLQEYKRKDSWNYKEIAMRNLTGSIILNSCNKKIYTVEGIAWNKTPKDTFVDHGKVPITLTEYYKRKYNIDIKDIDQPLLASKVTTTTVDGVKQENLIYLVPELCSITGFIIRNDFIVEENDGSQRQIKAETVYELLQEYQRANLSNFQEIATKNVTGLVVFNPCNKKTYIVKDIAWDMTPRDTYFNDAGVPTTYSNCYKRRYNIDIQDKTQPLLKNQIIKTGGGYDTEDMLHLIPEYSYLTGLAYTRRDILHQEDPESPKSFVRNNDQRMVTLRTYLEKVRSSEATRKVLTDWGLKIVDAARVDDSPEVPLCI